MSAEDALLPWTTDGMPGLRLLAEYFGFPEKFLCVDVTGAARLVGRGCGNAVELRIHLGDVPPDLERSLDRDSFALFCTPVINLIERACQPIELAPGATEWPLIPAAKGQMRSEDLEIWSVTSVRALRPDGGGTELPRVFQRMEAAAQGPAYTVTRRPAAPSLKGDLVMLGLVAPDQPVAAATYHRLAAEALCISRDTTRGRPLLSLSPAALTAERSLPGVEPTLRVIAPASECLRPPPRANRAWLLIAHLSMNHLIRADATASAARIGALLRLYDLRQAPDVSDAIKALAAVRATDGVARLPGPHGGTFCRAIDVTLEFDAGTRPDAVFPLASVLDQVLRLHAPINGVVRTTVALQGHPEPLHRFPARSGTRERL